jgi:integrase
MKRTRGLGGTYQRGDVWWVQFYVRGERHRESTESINRADAIKLLKKRIAEGQQPGRPIGAQVEKTTLADLAQILLDDYRANGRRSLDRLEFAIAHLKEFFGPERRATDLTSDRMASYQAYRQEQKRHGRSAANATINYELAMLRRAFRLAARAGKVAFRPEFEMLHVENARKGFFEADQYRAVVERLPDYLKPVAMAAYITGWRTKSELLSRQWRHVDLDAGWLRLDPGEGKTAEGRMFPVTPELRALLEGQRERVRDLERASGQIIPWIFVHADGTPIRNFRYAWAKACKDAGVPGRLVHDFRRTAVRNLERAGVPRSAAMKITGHKTETVYRRYAIVDEGMMRDAAEKLAALHQADTGKKAAPIVVALAKAGER